MNKNIKIDTPLGTIVVNVVDTEFPGISVDLKVNSELIPLANVEFDPQDNDIRTIVYDNLSDEPASINSCNVFTPLPIALTSKNVDLIKGFSKNEFGLLFTKETDITLNFILKSIVPFDLNLSHFICHYDDTNNTFKNYISIRNNSRNDISYDEVYVSISNDDVNLLNSIKKDVIIKDGYLLDSGCLLSSSNKEYDAYANVYDKQHGFYDFNQFMVEYQDEAFKEALNYVEESNVQLPYAVVTIQDYFDEDDISNVSYDKERIIYSVYKNENGDIIENFLK